MWTSTIANTDYRNGILLVNVVYSSDQQPPVNNVTQSIDMTGGSLDVLNQKVQAQLDTLNATDDLATQIPIGAFVPDVPLPDPETAAIVALQQAQNLVDLGVITTDDPEYTSALTAAQSAVKTSGVAKSIAQ